VVADLSFADLLLVLQRGDGRYVVAEQCRPSTVMTLRIDDVVGNEVKDDLIGELDTTMRSNDIVRSTVLRDVERSTVCNVYAPVRHNGKNAWRGHPRDEYVDARVQRPLRIREHQRRQAAL
jgi:hypothetical protein